jgi:hypothetical protein
MEKTHENWRLILEAAPAVTAAGQTPFTRRACTSGSGDGIRALITTGQASTRHSRA